MLSELFSGSICGVGEYSLYGKIKNDKYKCSIEKLNSEIERAINIYNTFYNSSPAKGFSFKWITQKKEIERIFPFSLDEKNMREKISNFRDLTRIFKDIQNGREIPKDKLDFVNRSLLNHEKVLEKTFS